MKYVVYINWAIIGFLVVFCVWQLATINSSGLDAAGKGMASGFSIVILIAAAILGGLNLINANWLRVGILMVFIVAFLYLNS